MSKNYSVYVGGVEVNNYYIDYERALELAFDYIDDDYTDVQIVSIGGSHVSPYAEIIELRKSYFRVGA